MIPLAFYAPLKSPDHPTPSGDRTMARLLMAALERAGFGVRLASAFRSFEPAGLPERQAAIAQEAEAEAERVAAAFAALPEPERPRLWFTYHSYYKAPDHLGPALSRRLGIPYALAEASRAGKRAGGPWAIGHDASERAIGAASRMLCMTAHDREALAKDPAIAPILVRFPPFSQEILENRIEIPERRREFASPRLLAVGMMRSGDKLRSFAVLAEALGRLSGRPWTLDIAGDGPERPAVEAAFEPLGDRVRFHGRLDAEALGRLYGAADLLVWPAVNEAYGMALLEAQAAGCPVVAGAYGGVADALAPGRTGLLVPPGDVAGFAAAVASLLDDPARRRAMGAAAARFVREERSLEGAAAILRGALVPLLGERPDVRTPTRPPPPCGEGRAAPQATTGVGIGQKAPPALDPAVIPGLAEGENPEPTTGLRSLAVGSGLSLREPRNDERSVAQRRRILFCVTHLLGAGHLTRTAAIARASAARGDRVTLVSGGRPSPLVPTDGVELVQLPPVRATAHDLSTLLTAEGEPADAAYLADRRDRLVATLRRVRPEIVVTELFPFGRRSLAAEFDALIAAAEAMAPRPLLCASIRDILVAPGRPAKAERTHDLVRRHYAAVLVHADPSLVTLGESWPAAPDLPLRYTGYVDAEEDGAARPSLNSLPRHAEEARHAPSRSTQNAGACFETRLSGAPQHDEGGDPGRPLGATQRHGVVISGGSSAAALPLYEAALGAAARLPAIPMRLLVGHGVEEHAFRRLATSAPDAVIVERARPDFRALLRGAALLVGQCGYNTVTDVLATGIRALFVPFEQGAETEQRARAERLCAKGFATLLPERELSAKTLAAAICAALAAPLPATADLDRDGAARSAAILAALAAGQPGIRAA